MDFVRGGSYPTPWEIALLRRRVTMSRQCRCGLAFAALLAITAAHTHFLRADAPKAAIKPAPEAAIRQALTKPLEVNYRKLPLKTVANRLEEKLGVSVQLDAKPLADSGINTDASITFHSTQVSAKATIALMLRELDITTIIRDESLLITTREEADNFAKVRVYEVTDLVPVRATRALTACRISILWPM